MVLGKVVEYCISAVTIVNYCAQCELLIFYLREINIRMEEKTKDLGIIMKVLCENIPSIFIIVLKNIGQR